MQILGQKVGLTDSLHLFPAIVMQRRGTPVVTAPLARLDLIEIVYEHQNIPALARICIDPYQLTVLLPKRALGKKYCCQKTSIHKKALPFYV